MNYNDILYSFCCRNDTDQVKKTLDRYDKDRDQLDILDEEGIFFKLAISNNNYEICDALISFFENKQNPSTEEKEQLQDMLEETTSFADISKEMRLVLKNYVPYEEDSRLEEDFSDLEDVDYKSWLEQIKKENDDFQSTTGSNGPEKDDVLKDIITDSSGYLLEKNQIGLVGDKALIHNEEGVYHIFDNINNHEI
jgi:hypothetical protein